MDVHTLSEFYVPNTVHDLSTTRSNMYVCTLLPQAMHGKLLTAAHVQHTFAPGRMSTFAIKSSQEFHVLPFFWKKKSNTVPLSGNKVL